MIKKAFIELETHAWCAERFRTNEIRLRTLLNTKKKSKPTRDEHKPHKKKEINKQQTHISR